MDDKIKKYLKLSKEFAINQLIERWLFEIQINKELFSYVPDLSELINDTHSVLNLSNEEYKKIYRKVLNKINKL